MANPTLTKKESNRLTFNKNAKQLFQVIYKEQMNSRPKEDEAPKIRVSEIISKMAFYYEKIRNTVDYKEENLLLKNAIERILKRQIVIEGVITTRKLNSQEIAAHLLAELIRAAYLPNNTIHETKIDEIAVVLEKYLKLRKYSAGSIDGNNFKDRNDLTNWVISLAASDIEERLGRNRVDRTVVGIMYEILTENIRLPHDSLFEKDKEIQIWAGIHRSYLKFDREMLSFVLFKYYVPDWEKAGDDEVKRVASYADQLVERINYQIEHPLSGQLNRIISRYTVIFSMLVELIEEDPRGIYEQFQSDPKAFARQIKKVCNKRYSTVRRKLWRAGIRSIIYIFITKSIFAVLLEVPATKWFGEEINAVSLAINIVFPAFLLFVAILFTRLPADDNSAKIIQGIEEVVFEEKKREEPFQLRRPAIRGKMLNTIFGIIYSITFFLSFGFVVWALRQINFSLVSIVIFLFFLAFVSFFSIRIRKHARELIIIEGKENIFSFIVDFFYVPIVSAGKWLSEKFSKINVFVFFLDIIIEAPFKIFVEIAEEWTKYVKERKDEIG